MGKKVLVPCLDVIMIARKIELIQYGRRILKKVYCRDHLPLPPPLPRCKLSEKVDNLYTFTSVRK